VGTSMTALSFPTYASEPLWLYRNGFTPSGTFIPGFTPFLTIFARYLPCCCATYGKEGFELRRA